jgi:hypothetical protein
MAVYRADDLAGQGLVASQAPAAGRGPAAGQGPVIAIVGGGASGTLAALCLLREAASRRVPLRIALIDRHGRHGLGQVLPEVVPGERPAELGQRPVEVLVGQLQLVLDLPGLLVGVADEHGDSPA